MRFHHLLAVLLLAAVPAAAQMDKSVKKPGVFDRERYRIPHQKFVLDNGLTLLVHEDHSVPIVAVNLWYHVGSRNETRGKTGFAHLFEHFFFNGSEHFPGGFREAMDDLGANNRNGTTNTDRTNFFEDVPVSGLERTLYLEADRMGFLAGNISKEMLERERGVVQNEKRQGENQPYGRVFQHIAAATYPYSHPYSWSTIGSMDDLNAASLDDVKEWYRTYYGPNNCVLSLAGDITPNRALELVTKYFGSIPPGPPLRSLEEWIPRFDRNVRDQMEDRVPQARIYRVYHVPGWRSEDTQALELFAEALSGSKSSPLDRRMIYEKKLATAVTAGVLDRELAGQFLVTATVKPGVKPADVEAEMDAIIDELIKNGPSAAELQRAQTRRLADFTRGMERLGGFGGRSDILAESMTFGGSPDAYLDRLELLAISTPADVKAAAQKWLTAPHYTMTVTPYPQLAATKSDLDRNIEPALGSAPEGKFPAIQRAKLANGLSVMLLERHTAPLVNVAVAVDAGFASDSTEKAGLASLALALMEEGTTSRDTFKIADELDSLGAQINTGSSLDWSFVRLSALPSNLRPSLDLLADVVLHPAFPAEMFTVVKRQRLSRIAQEKSEPTTAAQRVAARLLYGPNHAYGNPLTGTGYEKSVEAITREDLAAWHRAWFVPGNSTIIATGDVTLKELVPALEKAFGDWKPGQAPKKKLEKVAATSGKKVYLIDKPGAPQSVIVAAHVSEPGGRAEDLPIEAVIRGFGGMATSRLNRNLRLDKHWSYGTQTTLREARGQRPLMIIAPVQTDKTKESILEVQKEIRDIAGERPYAGEEFEGLVRNLTMRLPGRFETLGALELGAINILNYGYPDDYYVKYANRAAALSPKELDAAAKSYIHPDQMVWIVVGDLKTIEPGIRELNLGEVIHLDANGEPVK